MDSRVPEYVVQLRSLYRQVADVRLAKPLFRRATSEADQRAVLDYVVHDPIVVQYPPWPGYRDKFLKAFLEALQEAGTEDILDELVSAAVEACTAVSVSGAASLQTDYYYRTFEIVPQAPPITVRVKRSFSDVGLALWDAAFALADYIVSNPDLVRDQRVLELGAGAGLTGLAALALGASHVVLTDYAASVLDNLREASRIQSLRFGTDRIRVEPLDWSQPDDAHLRALSPQVVLAADCIYDYDLATLFARTVACLLRQCAGACVLVAQTRRSDDVFEHWLREMQRAELAMHELSRGRTPPAPGDHPTALPCRWAFSGEHVALYRVQAQAGVGRTDDSAPGAP